MQAIFAYECNNTEPVTKDSPEIIAAIPQIDQKIALSAPKWPIDKINKVDLAILRIAIWEIENAKDTPAKVIIDESIELAKEFGAKSSPSFINGVLGTVIKEIPSEE